MDPNQQPETFPVVLNEIRDVNTKLCELQAEKIQNLQQALRRSRMETARIRAECRALREEKKDIIGVIEACKHHISVSGNTTKIWAVNFVLNQVEKARHF